MTKALTIRQPHASLIAVGAKWIETRSWTTAYIGPLIIHAGAAKPPVEMMEDGMAGEIGDPDARWFQWCQGEDAPASSDWYLYDCTAANADTPTPGAMWTMPLGALVASCQLADVVPIIQRCGTDMHAPAHLCHSGDSLLLHRPEGAPFPNGDTERDVSDQLPFGNFDPGGFAWLLEDEKATTERCPWCWGRGRVDHPVPGVSRSVCEASKPCPVCWPHNAAGIPEFWAGSRAGFCEPIPTRGRQGLWDWAPEEEAV